MGLCGLVPYKAAMKVAKWFGGYGEGGHGYVAVVVMLVVVYSINFCNALSLRKTVSVAPRP